MSSETVEEPAAPAREGRRLLEFKGNRKVKELVADKQ